MSGALPAHDGSVVETIARGAATIGPIAHEVLSRPFGSTHAYDFSTQRAFLNE